MDDDLQALARERRKTPSDASLVLRHARALARAGETEEAEAALVAGLDSLPGQPELTAELDALTGGRARGAPWPSPRGDPGLTGRSKASGPTRGEVVFRRELELEGTIEGLAVASPGRALALTKRALYVVTEKGEVELVRKLPHGVHLESIVLLPGKRILLLGASQARVLLPGEPSGALPLPGIFGEDREPDRVSVTHQYARSFRFAAGSSGLLYSASREGRVLAFPTGVPAEARTIRPGENCRATIALAPGGDLVLVREASKQPGRPSRLERIDSRGELRYAVELSSRGFTNYVAGPIVDEQGSAYMGIPGARLSAHDASGDLIFERRYPGEPVALAGESGEVLVIRDRNTLGLLERSTGKELATWGGSFFGVPKIDARGWVYVRREDDLVAWDPRSPRAPAFEARSPAGRGWDFVFSGDGRAMAFPRVGTAHELLVIE